MRSPSPRRGRLRSSPNVSSPSFPAFPYRLGPAVAVLTCQPMRRDSARGGWSFPLRAHLLFLVVGTVLPTLSLSAVLAGRVMGDRRDAVHSQLLEAARAEATIIDSELLGTIRALRALAES